MFDIGATELLLVVIVALLVIGPKDLPLAMRTAGRWMGKVRAMTKHFRVGIDSMIRDAEIEEQEKLWAERNEKIMREHPPEDVGTEQSTEQEGDPHRSASPASEAGSNVSPAAPEQSDDGPEKDRSA